MGYQEVSNSYLKNQVMSASPHKLIVLLYEGGAIKNLKRAELSLTNQNALQAHQQLVKAQDIISELRSALNEKIDSKLPQELGQLYDFMERQLVRANVNKDKDLIAPVIKMLEELLDAWRQIKVND
nr:flagellar export chaperone FliS [Liquorilactobacillus satsumensis]